MTPEQIAYLEQTMKPGFYNNGLPNMYGQREDKVWREAFREYNEVKSNTKLGMGCSPCYAKVLLWHKRKLSNEPKFAIKDGKFFKVVKIVK